MRLTLAPFALLALVAARSASAPPRQKVLNVFTWPDYIAPNTIANFEREYGIKVNYDTYDSTEMAEARLLAGRTGYDVIVHAGALLGAPDPDRRSTSRWTSASCTNLAYPGSLGDRRRSRPTTRATATACLISGARRASRTTSA